MQLAVSPDTRWPGPFDDVIASATHAGFDSLGVWDAVAASDTRAAFDTAGLQCHEVLALAISRNEEKTLERAAALAEGAAVMGADWVLTLVAHPLGPDTAQIIERSAAIIHEAGARMAVEFSPLGPITSIGGALEVVDVAGSDRAGVLIDTWHFFRGDSTWDDLATIPVERIAYLQFDDALPAETDDLIGETLNRRAMPGEGEFDLERFTSTLRDRGWDGVVSVEVLSARLNELPLDDFMVRAHESTARFWR
jgi:sugar phosphate isomerase/epimerase